MLKLNFAEFRPVAHIWWQRWDQIVARSCCETHFVDREVRQSMTTRSGRVYKESERERIMAEGPNIAELLKALMEDRSIREREVAKQMERMQKLVEESSTERRGVGDRVERDKVQLTKFSESDDIESYLETFERMMQAYDVPRARWVFKLAPQLTGRAQQAYTALSSDDAKDYATVKTAILARYDINCETYRRRLRGSSKNQGETYRQLATRIFDMTKKWTKECGSVADVQQLIAVEQYLRALPEGIRVWVGERKPKTAAEAGQLAEDYLQARGPVSEEKRKQPGAGDALPSLVKKCFSCGQSGHIAKSCPGKTSVGRSQDGTPNSSRQRNEREIRCYSCGEKGHVATRCPAKAYFCGGPRVSEKVRRSKQGKGVYCTGIIEGTPVTDVLLDTGCSRSLVRKELIPSQNLKGDAGATVVCACGDSITYPLTDVTVLIGGSKLIVEAGVSDTLPVSMLLGTDVPEMASLLRESTFARQEKSFSPAGALVVETRAQARERERVEALEKVKEITSMASPRPVQTEESPEEEQKECDDDDDHFLEKLDDEVFQPPTKVRERQSRASKREERRQRYKERWNQDIQDPNWTAEEIGKMQQEDESLEKFRRLAEEASSDEEETPGPFFYGDDGLLYRRWVPRNAPDDVEQPLEQLVLPTACRKMVMELAHAIPMAGHLGKTKTADRILQRFYWPTLHRDVASFCRSCPQCQKCSRKARKVPLVPLPVMSVPFSRIAMDLVGPLPRSNRYVLVICDYATRYPEAIPLRNIDAEHIAGELTTVFTRLGIPDEILTDQGSNFMSGLLKEVYNFLRVKPIKTSPYHPQTDGLVERFNGTLKSMLRKTADENGKDWDKLLPFLLFAYREVPQASTGFSPFELMFGRPIRGPLDILRETWVARKQSSESVVSYLLAMREKFERMKDIVEENLGKAQSYQKSWYDQNARDREFNPGDCVLVMLPTSTSKLLAQWEGPYTVVRRVGKVDYEIEMDDKARKKKRIFHTNMLRKWHQDDEIALAVLEQKEEEDEDGLVTWDAREEDPEEQPKFGQNLTEGQRCEIQELLQEYPDVMRNRPGRTNMMQHRISVKEDVQPIRQMPYRLPHAYRELVRKELDEMEDEGIIEKSTSEWASPIVLVGKNDGTMRMCIDFRRLNEVAPMDAYPMPRVDELLDKLGGAEYITTLDLCRGYWQVPMEEFSRPLTAFTTPFGLFQCRVMPFGLNGAPATFQRLMDEVLRGLEILSSAYIDDIAVYSTNWREHLLHVRSVLERLRRANLTAKPRKCQFGMIECTFLGHIVGHGQVRPHPDKIDAVVSFPVPETKKQVRTFLGLTGYYRKFIPHYSTIAAPLTDLTKKSEPNRIIWNEGCEQAFRQLQGILCSGPVLRNPNFDQLFILQTDASNRGVGAVLSQAAESGEEHPVAYYSRKLLPREEKYAVIEKECLAIKLAVHTFRTYLLGRTFLIQTDHHALEWLNRIKNDNPRLTRWSLALQPYQFTIRHRPGVANQNADALSRGPVVNQFTTGEGGGSVMDQQLSPQGDAAELG